SSEKSAARPVAVVRPNDAAKVRYLRQSGNGKSYAIFYGDLERFSHLRVRPEVRDFAVVTIFASTRDSMVWVSLVSGSTFRGASL
ncbi:MAG: hypothetical protein WCO86_06580, partial [Planctomycetota bacterium]